MIEIVINIILFVMLVATALAILSMEGLFAVVMLAGVFSLLSALLFVVLDAVDVAFTEAAVGAGISTVLMLGTIAQVRRTNVRKKPSPGVPLAVVMITAAVLVYGTLDMPRFGNPQAPAQTHVLPDYLERTVTEIDVPNVVTAILASYRGYDTLGETAVVFTAGIGVLLLIGGLRRGRRDEEEEEDA